MFVVTVIVENLTKQNWINTKY